MTILQTTNVPNNYKSALIHVMAWHRTGDMPLSEPVMGHFADAI